MSSLNEYWEALERLSTNEPIRVPKGSSINNDTVAIEAGRKRGSIKNQDRHFLLSLMRSQKKLTKDRPPPQPLIS